MAVFRRMQKMKEKILKSIFFFIYFNMKNMKESKEKPLKCEFCKKVHLKGADQEIHTI